MKKYSNKELDYLANADLVWPKKSNHYDKLLRQSFKEKGFDYSVLHDDEQVNDVCHDELWMDTGKMVNYLAQLVLDEREKTREIIKDLNILLKSTINEINRIK